MVVTKINSDGSALIFSTYIGGFGSDDPLRVALDPTGNIYIVGTTQSHDLPMFTSTPSKKGSYDPYCNGGPDGFIFKLSSDGSTLLASTYLGGRRDDSVEDIAIDKDGKAVYVTGITESLEFPYTLGAYSPGLGGKSDAFVSCLDADLSIMNYSTLIGGRFDDGAYGIAIDNHNNAYITGYTLSDNFHTTPFAYDRKHGDGGTEAYDAFVTEVNADGTDLIFSTYLGGVKADTGKDIALDKLGNIWIAGETLASDFPHTADAYDPIMDDAVFFEWEDIFICRLDPSGSFLQYSTFFGGWGSDWVNKMVLDSKGCLYIVGSTDSPNFPTTAGAFDTSYNGIGAGGGHSFDSYMSRFSPDGRILNYSTFVGGTDYEFGYGIALDNLGYVYVTGNTQSVDFPTTPKAIRAHMSLYHDMFITKLFLPAYTVPVPMMALLTLLTLLIMLAVPLIFFILNI